ncbi:LysR family transcriptional regulator [Planctomycetota bacterium]
MQIETLKIFMDLAELRSFSKSADKNSLSQSAISQRLTQLEEIHNCRLVNRSKRPIELTKEGQLVYRACKDILKRYKRLKDEINAVKSTPGNRINVGAIFSIGMHSLPRYVKQFMAKYPKVHVHIEYLSARRIYELVLSGGIDIGLVAVPKRDKRLEVYDFENEPLSLVCSSRHPLADESEIDIRNIQFERFIAFEKGMPTRLCIDNILHRYDIVVEPVLEFDNIETVKRAVEINSGISILPDKAVEQEVSNGTIRAIPFSNERFYRPTGAIVRKGKILSRQGRSFIELLCQPEQ